jgi:hypothetical protein
MNENIKERINVRFMQITSINKIFKDKLNLSIKSRIWDEC